MSSVFTYFSKAVSDSFGLSFSRSAKDNCDTSCRLWSSCYAARIERIYTSLEAKLSKAYHHGPLWVVNRAIAEMPVKRIRWARFSVDGSLPKKSSMSPKSWSLFVKRLRVLVAKAQDYGAKWHIPVESPSKAKAYRAALAGLDVVVRRTSQAKRLADVISQSDHRSWVVGERIHRGHVSKAEKQRNAKMAFVAADQIRASGQTAIVCPAIVSTSKCGKCTACSDSRVDIVLYPFHG